MGFPVCTTCPVMPSPKPVPGPACPAQSPRIRLEFDIASGLVQQDDGAPHRAVMPAENLENALQRFLQIPACPSRAWLASSRVDSLRTSPACASSGSMPIRKLCSTPYGHPGPGNVLARFSCQALRSLSKGRAPRAAGAWARVAMMAKAGLFLRLLPEGVHWRRFYKFVLIHRWRLHKTCRDTA